MESLTHSSALKALIILLKKKESRMTIKEIATDMGEAHGEVVHAINVLEDGKLLESHIDRGAPYDRDVALTPVGRIVAIKIKEIEELIGWMGREGIS